MKHLRREYPCVAFKCSTQSQKHNIGRSKVRSGDSERHDIDHSKVRSGDSERHGIDHSKVRSSDSESPKFCCSMDKRVRACVCVFV